MNGINHTCLCLPSRIWSSFTDPEGMEGWVVLGTTTLSEQTVQDRYVTEITVASCPDRHASLGVGSANLFGFLSECCCLVAESAAQLNMRAVFLHVLGDALGSVVVIISALLIKFLQEDWKYKIDPVLRCVRPNVCLRTLRACCIQRFKECVRALTLEVVS